MTKQPLTHGNAPNLFIQKYQPRILGVLCGFDRIRLRGTLRQLYCPKVMEAYLSSCRVLLKHFSAFAQTLTEAVKAKAQALAEAASRPFVFLGSSQTSKEQVARQIAARDGIKTGLIAVLRAVEPCQALSVRGNRATKQLEVRVEARKCTHLYFYYAHARFGFMHLRLQTWFPFQVNVCLNGRHWLARQMDQNGLAYLQKENTFIRVSDYAQAQGLLDQQLSLDWVKEMGSVLKEVHPLAKQICRPLDLQYYWSASDTEYATDVVFKNAASLASLYPGLVHHALSSFASPDVLRFLGRYVPASTGLVWGQFDGEIISDSKRRPEGVRVKHSVNGNSIKFYDKQGSVLRVETTIIHPEEFKTYRKPEGRPKEAKRWLPLRRGLADMKRRAQISAKANERYLQALASASGKVPLREWTQKLCQPVCKDGHRFRALNPWAAEDAKLLALINQGTFAVNGFRNRDLCREWFRPTRDPQEQKRRTAWMCRRLRLLRAHGLVQKVSGTHRYLLSTKGRQVVTALLAARNADAEQLTKLAA